MPEIASPRDHHQSQSAVFAGDGCEGSDQPVVPLDEARIGISPVMPCRMKEYDTILRRRNLLVRAFEVDKFLVVECVRKRSNPFRWNPEALCRGKAVDIGYQHVLRPKEDGPGQASKAVVLERDCPERPVLIGEIRTMGQQRPSAVSRVSLDNIEMVKQPHQGRQPSPIAGKISSRTLDIGTGACCEIDTRRASSDFCPALEKHCNSPRPDRRAKRFALWPYRTARAYAICEDTLRRARSNERRNCSARSDCPVTSASIIEQQSSSGPDANQLGRK